MRLDVAVHDAFTVAVVQCLEQLVYVVPHVIVLELWVQTPEVGVVNIFENQRGCFALRCRVLASASSTRQQVRTVYPISYPVGAITDLVVAHYVE